MKLRLLGTGAADGIPGLFADNMVSRYAREHGGKDVRTRTSAIVDDHLLIDMGPDIWYQMSREKLSGRDITGLIFTHGHDDHFALNEIQYAMFPFVDDQFLPFAIYANPQVAVRVKERYPDWPIELHEVHPYTTFQFTDYTVTTIEANHKEDEEALNLLIEKDGRTLLYATDTGIWPENTFKFMKGRHVDVCVIECTDGFHKTPYFGHLDIAQCTQMVAWMRQYNVLGPDSRVITTHHSHEGGARHCDLIEALLPHGMEPGYDGMVIEI